MRTKVADHTQYEKDSFSKGVINVDNNALSAYKLQRKNLLNAVQVSKEINELKDDIKEIKNLLSQIINNK